MLAEMGADMKANREERKADWKLQEMRAIMKIHCEEMRTIFGADQGKTEVTDLKAYLEEMQSEVEHQEIPKEDAILKLVRGWKKRHRDRNLAADLRQKPKERTQGNCGFQKKFTAADRTMTRHANKGCYKRNCKTNWTRDKIERGSWRVWALRKRLQACQEGIKDLGGKQPLYIRKNCHVIRCFKSNSFKGYVGIHE
jgi:hypothetical protein